MSDTSPLRVFVCGSRDFRNEEVLCRVLDAVHERTGIALLVEGGDRAGLLAAEWATRLAIPTQTIRGTEKDAAGLTLKAERIVAEGRPHLGIGFWGGQRTSFLMERLARAGVRTYAVARPEQAPATG